MLKRLIRQYRNKKHKRESQATSELRRGFLYLLLADDLVKGGRILAHLLSVGVVGNPTGGLAGRDFVHHSVNLFKRKALGFRYEEVGEENADEASRTPKEEDLGSEVCLVLSDEVWGNDSTTQVLARFLASTERYRTQAAHNTVPKLR
jgi:hypothetical protein